MNYKFNWLVFHWRDEIEEIRCSDDHVRIHISSGSCHVNKTAARFFILSGCDQMTQQGGVALNLAAKTNCG